MFVTPHETVRVGTGNIQKQQRDKSSKILTTYGSWHEPLSLFEEGLGGNNQEHRDNYGGVTVAIPIEYPHKQLAIHDLGQTEQGTH